MNVAAPVSTRRERISWYLYDFGNSAYASVILLSVFTLYFKGTIVGGAEGTRLWGLSITIAMLVVAIISPFLGAIADYSRAKKPLLLFFTTMACIFTGLLFFTKEGTIVTAMIFFILAEIGYRGSQVFYDALLTQIARPEEMGKISGIGWAIGSLGGIVALLVVLVPIMLTDSDPMVVRFSFVITAVFYAVASLPIFLWLPEKGQARKLPPGENYLSIAIKQLSNTIRTAGSFKEFLKFMLAYLIYNDGVIMALEFAAIIGAVLFGLAQESIIILFIIVHVTSIIGAYAFGLMVDRTGGKPTLVISISLLLASVIGLYFSQSAMAFFVIASVAGFALTGAQSVSRTMVAFFAPQGKSGEFFGFFAVVGRTSSFIGPGIFGWLAAEATIWYASQGQDAILAEQSGHRLAIWSIVAFLVVGLLLLGWVNEKKARQAAAENGLESWPATPQAIGAAADPE